MRINRSAIIRLYIYRTLYSLAEHIIWHTLNTFRHIILVLIESEISGFIRKRTLNGILYGFILSCLINKPIENAIFIFFGKRLIPFYQMALVTFRTIRKERLFVDIVSEVYCIAFCTASIQSPAESHSIGFADIVERRLFVVCRRAGEYASDRETDVVTLRIKPLRQRNDIACVIVSHRVGKFNLLWILYNNIPRRRSNVVLFYSQPFRITIVSLGVKKYRNYTISIKPGTRRSCCKIKAVSVCSGPHFLGRKYSEIVIRAVIHNHRLAVFVHYLGDGIGVDRKKPL